MVTHVPAGFGFDVELIHYPLHTGQAQAQRSTRTEMVLHRPLEVFDPWALIIGDRLDTL